MARIRALKPEAFQSETLSEVSVSAERTFFGLTTQADDRGRLADKPAVLNGAIWPMRQTHTPADLEAELVELTEAGEPDEPLVCRYIGCDGKRYMHLVTWDRHQKVERPSKSRMPRCPHHAVSVTGAKEECSVHGAEPCPPRSLPEPSPKPQGKVGEPSPTDLGSWIVDRGPWTVRPTAGASPPATNAPRAEPDEPTSAQTLIAEWINHVPKKPPGTLINQVGKQLKAMLAEGLDPADVRAGLALWAGKNLHPSALPSVVNEVMNGGNALARASPGRPDQRRNGDDILADGLALAARLQAQEQP